MDTATASSWGRTLRAPLVPMAPARDVFVHHEGDPGGKGRDTGMVDTMRRLQRAAFGAGHNAIDYSFAASDTWKAEGRGWRIQGSHTLNHNRTSHAICAPGNYTLYDPRPGLIRNIAELIVEGVRAGAILEPFYIYPHSAVFGTACPGRLTGQLLAISQLARSILRGSPAPPAPGGPVMPQFNPPAQMISKCGFDHPAYGRCCAILLADGGMFCEPDAAYVGSVNMPQMKAAFGNRKAARVEATNADERAAGKLYKVIASDSAAYHFPIG